MRNLRALVVVFIVSLFAGCFFSYSESAHAQSPSPSGLNSMQNTKKKATILTTPEAYNKALDACETGGSYARECYISGTTGDTAATLKTYFIGRVSSDGTVTTGAVGSTGKAISMLIGTPPASSQEYLADLLEHSRVVPQAYAQGVGIGFKGLSPVLPIWKTFLNLAYVAFVIIFVVIGFMIIFRKKLHGQTVVTVANALPNLVVTLIIITFSYAIAGFVIDLMYLTIYLVIGVFSTFTDDATLAGNPVTLTQIALGNDVFTNLFTIIFGDGAGTGGNRSVTSSSAQAVSDIVAGFFNSQGGLGTYLSTAFGTLTNVIMQLILAVAMLFVVVKVFVELLKSYVTFIISVIFSPIELLISSFSGQGGFTQWLRNMIGNLAPFPVVIGMIFLAMAFGGYGKGDIGYQDAASGGFQPPLIAVRGSGVSIANAIQGLIALGVLMLMPQAIEIAREAVGAKKGFFDKYLPAITENLKKGIEGGQLVPGFGPKIPGVGKALPSALGLGATSALTGIAGAGVGAYSQRGAGIGKIIAGGLTGGAIGAAVPVGTKYVMPAVEKVATFGQKQLRNIRYAEDIAKSFSPNRVPESPKTIKQKNDLQTLNPQIESSDTNSIFGN